MIEYRELTADNGIPLLKGCRDRGITDTFIVRSAILKDKITNYKDRYQNNPTKAWYLKHARWDKIKNKNYGMGCSR